MRQFKSLTLHSLLLGLLTSGALMAMTACHFGSASGFPTISDCTNANQCFSIYKRPASSAECSEPASAATKEEWAVGWGPLPPNDSFTISLQRNKSYESGGGAITPDPATSYGPYTHKTGSDTLGCYEGREGGINTPLYVYSYTSMGAHFGSLDSKAKQASDAEAFRKVGTSEGSCINLYSGGKYKRQFTELASLLSDDSKYPVEGSKIGKTFLGASAPLACSPNQLMLRGRNGFDISASDSCEISFEATDSSATVKGHVALGLLLAGTRTATNSPRSTTFAFNRGQAPKIYTFSNDKPQEQLSGDIASASISDSALTVRLETTRGNPSCVKYHFLK